MADFTRNTEGLKANAKQKSQRTREKVDKAIEKLIKSKLAINFCSVAEMSGVSKTFLYVQKDIKERIEHLRKQQHEVFSPAAVKQNMNKDNKDALIEIQRSKLKNMREEMDLLKQELSRHRAKMYETI